MTIQGAAGRAPSKGTPAFGKGLQRSTAAFALLGTLLSAGAGAAAPRGVGARGRAVDEAPGWVDAPLTVASTTARAARDQPAVVTVVTREEILDAGARTLTDVLRLIPGLDVAYDLAGVNGWSMRGIWAQEGKALLIIDGQVYNDPAWGGVRLNGRFPIENIRRIEVIRGPGSVQYGSHAQTAVVRITTVGAELNGTEAFVTYGRMDGSPGDDALGTFGRARLAVNGGYEAKGLRLSVSLYGAQGIQSDLGVSDALDPAISTESGVVEDTQYRQLGVNLGASFKDLRFRFIAESFRHGFVTFLGSVSDHRYRGGGPSCSASIDYTWRLGPVTITPSVRYSLSNENRLETLKGESLWETGVFYDLRLLRTDAGLKSVVALREGLTALVGLQYYYVHAVALQSEPPWATVRAREYFAGEPVVSHGGVAAYAQVEWDSPIGNVAAGARVDRHFALREPAMVPRLALTRALGDFHFKALYARAYRMADVESINMRRPDTRLKPELSETIEGEIGYRFSEHASLTANLFDLRIDGPIVWRETTLEGRALGNHGMLGSRGLETELRLGLGAGSYVIFSYSYYRAKKGSLSSYVATSEDGAFVAQPQHKLAFSAHVAITEGVGVSSSLYAISERYDAARDGERLLYENRLDPLFLSSLWLSWRMSSGFTLAVGVHDLLNQRFRFVEATGTRSVSPVPGASREIIARLGYRPSVKSD